MLAGLISGDRAVEVRALEQGPVASAAVAETAAGVVHKASEARVRQMPPRTLVSEVSEPFRPAPAPERSSFAPVDERRLE